MIVQGTRKMRTSRGTMENPKGFTFHKIIVASALIAVGVSVLKSVICLEIKPGVHKYCREKGKVIDAEQVDEYLFVGTEINSTVVLECRFCEDQDKRGDPKIWYWQDSDQSSEIQEVNIDMDNNVSLSRVHVTSESSLIIRLFRENETGIYRCLGKNESVEESLYNYRLEIIEALPLNISDIRGDMAAYKKYKKANIDALNTEFAESDNEEFVGIREAGITLEVVTDWGVWSPCDECLKKKGSRKKGIKKKRGHCRLKRYYNESSTSESEILKMFRNNPVIPCKSRFLQEVFPSVSNATRHLPEFVLTEKCKPCKKEKKKKKRKFKYKKRYLLAQGAHLTLSCPNTTILSNITWMKDKKVLPRGKGHSFRKKDSTPRVYVDHYNTIYIKDISDPEQGKYTCSVDEQNMLRAIVVITPKRGILMEALVMHLKILGFILLLSTFLYCAGVVKACRHRDRFRIKSYEQLKEERDIFEDDHKSY